MKKIIIFTFAIVLIPFFIVFLYKIYFLKEIELNYIENRNIRVKRVSTGIIEIMPLEEYIVGEFDDECIECDEKSEMEEFMFLRLRMMNGLSTIEFEHKFGKNVDEVYGEVLKKHIKDGLIVREEDNIKLSDKGIDVSNYVLADFLLED